MGVTKGQIIKGLEKLTSLPPSERVEIANFIFHKRTVEGLESLLTKGERGVRKDPAFVEESVIPAFEDYLKDSETMLFYNRLSLFETYQELKEQVKSLKESVRSLGMLYERIIANTSHMKFKINLILEKKLPGYDTVYRKLFEMYRR